MDRASRIRAEMQVVGFDGGPVGKVRQVDGDWIKLADTGSVPDRRVPLSSVARVDKAVHLKSRASAAALAAERRGLSASRRAMRAARRRRLRMYLPWIVGTIAVILFLLFRAIFQP